MTTRCIRCALCLESCPTFIETGSELESPRGRIYLVRSASEGKLKWSDIAPHLDRCLGCRACETACPSGVEYGQILEIARNQVDRESNTFRKSLLLKATTSPTLMRLSTLIPIKKMPGFSADGGSPEAQTPTPQREANLPSLTNLPPVRGEVYFLEGCAMRVLFPRVHQATRRLLRRVGFTVREVTQGCCGALHAHNGDLETAHAMQERLFASMTGDLPIISNSAGCGSFLKEAENRETGGRVQDISEFLLANGIVDLLATSPGVSETITYHDACHLAHGQRIAAGPRTLLRAIPDARYVELAEADTCCGSAGIYNVLQPLMARKLLDRKYANVKLSGAKIVATGNPGCHAWIAQAAQEQGDTVRVLHTAELLEAAFSGIEWFCDDRRFG